VNSETAQGKNSHPALDSGGLFLRQRCCKTQSEFAVKKHIAISIGITLVSGLCVHATIPIALTTAPDATRLSAGDQTWEFTRLSNRWALATISVRGVPVAQALDRRDSFWLNSGEASEVTVLTNRPASKAVAFTVGTARVVYWVQSEERLPLVRIRFEGAPAPTFVLRSARSAADQHGAWLTRGYVATDLDAHEAFIDGSGPMVFGHSLAGGLDTGYLFIPRVLDHMQKNGRTEQRSATHFQSSRLNVGPGLFAGRWQMRFGADEPKELAVLLDRDLGGRVSDVCEKWFAPAVDTLVDLAAIPFDYDPQRCIEVMPVRLSAPDAFTPGYGWMMTEFPDSSYPFAHDATWQVPALLAFEGLATRRPWEQNFARYFLERTPLEGKDGTSYFVRRPGGLVRWGYWSTYRQPFPHFEGGVWWFADLLHRTAVALNDAPLQQSALDMVRHDLDVKLDLDRMFYPPCWNAIENRVGKDRRDDWFKTPGLAWCAWAAATLAYPQSRQPRDLSIADRITDWFAEFMVPEKKLNFLQGNNIHAVFSHYLPLAFLERFERTRDRRFLDLARDMAWVHILTACTTAARDPWGNPITGATCVGVRGCVDYDCSPHLCHEKDLTFVHLIGPLLDHVSGPAYAKYVRLHQLVLKKDAWQSAWVAELRDTNLRTIYDTFARGMANLIYGLNHSTNPAVVALEQRVSKSDTNVVTHRDVVLANGTAVEQTTRLRIPFLVPGRYELHVADRRPRQLDHRALEAGIECRLVPNSMRRILIRPMTLEMPATSERHYDRSVTFLSDLEPFAAQRGVGGPQPTYRKDRGFSGESLAIGPQQFRKGLGCAANTSLFYRLDARYERFRATVGIDHAVAQKVNPVPSVFFTAFVDGRLVFESGPVRPDTAAKTLDVDVRGGEVLLLRLSCNWDDDGKSDHDHGNWAEARLVGKATTPTP
jgi:hypothetical protein